MIVNEKTIECKIRKLLENEISALCKEAGFEIVILDNSAIADIIICVNGDTQKLFFIEVKYYKPGNNRIGFGQKGGGIQPEILMKLPDYLNSNMRWIFCREEDDAFYVLQNDECCNFVAGNKISLDKQNNFRPDLFENTEPLSELDLIDFLFIWISSTL